MTKVTVRRGDAEVTTQRGSENVHEGSVMVHARLPDDPEFQVVHAAAPRDDMGRLERSERDRVSGTSAIQQVRGVPTSTARKIWTLMAAGDMILRMEMCGLRACPQAGLLTRQGSGFGRITNGWTWVDYDPWGWALLSTMVRGTSGLDSEWTWFPGPRIGHYWYHPALVGFFGFGGGVGFGVGFGFGNVGWVPLAPFEVFRPWYGRGWFGGRNVIVNNVNNVRNVNIASTFRNAGVPGGARAVSAADFQRGAFNNQIAVNRTQLQQASLVRRAVPMSPTANNLRFTGRAASSAGPRGEISNQRFFSRMTPNTAATQRTPFAQQQAAVRSSLGERAPAGERSAAAASPQAGASGWQRVWRTEEPDSVIAPRVRRPSERGKLGPFWKPPSSGICPARGAFLRATVRPAGGGSNYAAQPSRAFSCRWLRLSCANAEQLASYSAPSPKLFPCRVARRAIAVLPSGGGHASGGHSGGHQVGFPA